MKYKKSTKKVHAQSHKTGMITQKEIDKIKKALPPNGYQLIANKTGKSYQVVCKTFNEPKRAKQEILDAALQVIEEYKLAIEHMKNKVKEVI